MAGQQDAMDTDSREAGITAAFEMEDDDPEARLRRRERREALKQAAREEEEDESLLDESDGETDGPTGEPAAAAEVPHESRVETDPPALLVVQAAQPLPPPPPVQAAATPTPTTLEQEKMFRTIKKIPYVKKLNSSLLIVALRQTLAVPASSSDSIR
jgi:hypothetical protein